MIKLQIPAGKSLYEDASFNVRRRLQETFKKFNINDYCDVVGESLLRLERVQRKEKRLNCEGTAPKDAMTMALYKMLQYYKSLK